MKFERLTFALHQLGTDFQGDALVIFGDDVDLVHGAEVALQRIADLLANVCSQLRRHYLAYIHPASLLATIAGNAFCGRIYEFKIAGKIDNKNNLVLACRRLSIGPFVMALVSHKRPS
ncbi:MAG TPA: hypothetical protein VNG71_09270 [Pyrinomonadaceae bacterium]|nr:hypothetical protein [Pyrinomonadaceae bacterium]